MFTASTISPHTRSTHTFCFPTCLYLPVICSVDPSTWDRGISHALLSGLSHLLFSPSPVFQFHTLYGCGHLEGRHLPPPCLYLPTHRRGIDVALYSHTPLSDLSATHHALGAEAVLATHHPRWPSTHHTVYLSLPPSLLHVLTVGGQTHL